MNGEAFFDTNVLIYAYCKNDPRASIAEALLSSGGVIGVQQLNEFVSVAHRKLRRSWQEIQQALDDLCVLCPNPRPITLATHEAALQLAKQYGYGIYDALVVAAAIKASCGVLYSKDMQDGQRIQGLTIRNPFRECSLPGGRTA